MSHSWERSLVLKKRNKILSNSVITNSLGLFIFVRYKRVCYNRVDLCTKRINLTSKSERYNRILNHCSFKFVVCILKFCFKAVLWNISFEHRVLQFIIQLFWSCCIWKSFFEKKKHQNCKTKHNWGYNTLYCNKGSISTTQSPS